MRITLFVQQFPVLSETFIVRKVAALAEAGHHVSVVSMHKPKKPAHQEVLDPFRDRITVRYLYANRTALMPRPLIWARDLTRAALRSPKDLRELWRLTQGYGSLKLRWYYLRRLYGLTGLDSADVYHFEFGGLATHLLEALEYFRPNVVSLRGSDINIHPLGNPEYANRLKKALNSTNRIHCVSQAIESKAAAMLELQDKTFVNYASIDTDFFNPLDIQRKKNLIVTVARYHWKKSLPTALTTIAQLCRKIPNLKYVIIGNGSPKEKQELMFHIHDLEISKQVDLYGSASATEVRELLSQAHVFFLPTLSEGLPNSMLEAMAMKVPVVVTDAGGIPEAVTDGIEGFVVPRRDYRTMTEKIKILLNNPELGRRMGKKGREKMLRQFTLEKQTKIFLDVYKELVQHGE